MGIKNSMATGRFCGCRPGVRTRLIACLVWVGSATRPALADPEMTLAGIAPSLSVLRVEVDDDSEKRDLEGFRTAYAVLHQEVPDYKKAHELFRERIKSKNPADPYLPYDYGWALVAAAGEKDWRAADRYYEYLASIRWPIYIKKKVKVDFRKQMREVLESAKRDAPVSKGAAEFFEKFRNVGLRITIPTRGAPAKS